MKEPTAHLDAVGSVVEALDELALEPVLVGGMALVVLGSRRVTRSCDFPLPAADLARRATTFKVRTKAWRVASEGDLLRLKNLARASRSLSGDAEDIAFLEARRTRGRR